MGGCVGGVGDEEFVFFGEGKVSGVEKEKRRWVGGFWFGFGGVCEGG